MAGATSWGALEAQIIAKMRMAMNVAKNKIESDMKKETQAFYTVGHPVLYDRTGNLGNSPKTTDVSGGKSMSFDAYLDMSYPYPVPNDKFTDKGFASYYTTPEVFDAAENNHSHVLGKGGFWRRAESKFQNDLDVAMARHFTRA